MIEQPSKHAAYPIRLILHEQLMQNGKPRIGKPTASVTMLDNQTTNIALKMLKAMLCRDFITSLPELLKLRPLLPQRSNAVVEYE